MSGYEVISEVPVVQFLPVEGIGLDVIQATKREPRIMRYELTDFEWAAITSFLPNKPRGIAERHQCWSRMDLKYRLLEQRQLTRFLAKEGPAETPPKRWVIGGLAIRFQALELEIFHNATYAQIVMMPSGIVD